MMFFKDVWVYNISLIKKVRNLNEIETMKKNDDKNILKKFV